MLDYIQKIRRARYNEKLSKEKNSASENKKEPEPKPVPDTADKCENAVKEIFGASKDIIVTKIDTQLEPAILVFVDGLVDSDLVDRDIIEPLKTFSFNGSVTEAINVSQFKEISDMNKFPGEVLDGNVVIFYGGSKEFVVADLKKHEKRSVTMPDSESVIRGPKEGFTETLRVNTSLLRRKLRTENLVLEDMTIGKQSRTKIVIAYLDDIVDKNVLKEVKKRLNRIDTDCILESGYIEQYIEDRPYSPISTVGLTQKPDIAAAMILEGRVAIICDGTPHVLTVPQLFVENIHTSEDYYNRYLISSFLRLIRVAAFIISTILPGFFVSMVTYNQEMLPTIFLMTLAGQRENIPFPSGIEVFLLMIMFEMLKESGTRLPKAVGSAISIVGALIIGDAAVSAGIVGAPTVIVIALTAVAGFIISSINEFVTIYRYIFLFLGATMGLIGIASGLVFMLTQLASTKSFGVPILASFNPNEIKDSFIKAPIRFLTYRPSVLVGKNAKRQYDKFDRSTKEEGQESD